MRLGGLNNFFGNMPRALGYNAGRRIILAFVAQCDSLL
jgi:hypothetical protein